MVRSVAVVGAGPAGLYFSYLLKRRWPDLQVRVIEQNAADATFGFGVVFSEQALTFLANDDPETATAIAPHMETWSNMTIDHRRERVTIDGIGFSAIGRLELLRMLQRRAADAGVEIVFKQAIDDTAGLTWADLIVGADGLNSVVRRSHAIHFQPTLSHFSNKFAWFGTDRPFDTLTQTFVDTKWGPFNAHHYRYAPQKSTFIVECGADTWTRAEFDNLDEDASRMRCEDIFSATLSGHGLISNKSVWRNFPRLWCERWYHRNIVLLGDALHTAHFSIGSGTRLAMEDAIALVRALEQVLDRHGDSLDSALASFEAARKPVAKKIVTAANTSAEWYETFGARMALSPMDFTFNYITRSGRIDLERLRGLAPEFTSAFERARPETIVDPVPDTAPCSVEIGFDPARHPNAGAILFDNLTNGNAERIAVTGPSGTLDYAQLCAFAAQYGNAFRAFGLSRGERILFFLDDTPSHAAAFFGAVRAGFVPVVLNTLTPPELLNFYLSDSGARLAVCDAAFAETFTSEACANTQLELTVVANGSATTPGADWTTEGDFLANHATTLIPAPTLPDDMAFWLYSSGSTGRPKGVVHLHHDMAYTAESYSKHLLGLRPDDVCYSPPKIFFAYGLGNSLTFPFSAGATTVLMPGQPRPETVLGAIERFRPTVLFALPTLYTALTACDAARGTDFSSLRLCVSAAEILSKDIFDAWHELTGHEPMEGLGSTEVLHIYLSNTPTRKKLGAAGKRVPGYDVELRDSEGKMVGDGAEGILWVRGHSNAPAYWNRPDKTAETMRGEWIYTGDRFVRDADGFYFFQGRADDLVKVSGQWVYPLEVERCLQSHPDVLECVVLAHELADRRTTLTAFVVTRHGPPSAPEATARQLQEHVKTALLPYKYPRQVIFLDGLPKTGTGKLDRQTLKNLHLKS